MVILTLDDLHRGDIIGVERPEPRTMIPRAIVAHQIRIGLPPPFCYQSHTSLACGGTRVVEMVPPRGRFYDLEKRTISRELHAPVEVDKDDDYAGCKLHVYRYDFTGRDDLRLALVDDAVYSANCRYNTAGVLAAGCALFRPLQVRTAEYCCQLIEDTYERHIGRGGLLPRVPGERSVPGGLCMSSRLVYLGYILMLPRAAEVARTACATTDSVTGYSRRDRGICFT